MNPSRILGAVFPIVQWSKSYDVSTGIGDLIAGITVALTLIPQSIAYASLAGLEPQVIIFVVYNLVIASIFSVVLQLKH